MEAGASRRARKRCTALACEAAAASDEISGLGGVLQELRSVPSGTVGDPSGTACTGN